MDKRRWFRGEVVQAKIVEVQKAGGVLVDIEGFLFLVKNQTAQPLSVGHRLALEVVSIAPLEFRIPSDRRFQRIV